MFRSARIKLTAWYLLIIMTISLSFSAVIYRGLTLELSRIEERQRTRLEQLPTIPRPPAPFFHLDPEVLEESRQRIRLALLAINLVILGVSGVAGYFLAGRTLKPIKEMVDEQNRFVADSSHELRTPLTALKTTTEVGLRDKKLTLKEARGLLKGNLDEINNLQVLSDKLLTLSRFDRDSGRIVLSKVKLAEIFREARKKVEVLAATKKMRIKIPEVHYSFKGDRNSLVELFVILLDNAIKYSPEGKLVEVFAARTDGKILIQVKDQGMGIAAKDLPHIFDRFYRVDKSRTADGYGLGLSIAKKIVEIHGGAIEVESNVGQGSTFKVFLSLNS